MRSWLDRLRFAAKAVQANPLADKGYVSEFTRFMDGYLESHPEVVSDQREGWYMYWNKNVDLAAQVKATQDSVRDDGYGFYASAWHRDQPR